MNRIWWCPNCQRTYQEGQQRGKWPFRLCSYKDCNTLADVGQIDWQMILANNPGLPEAPEKNIRYGLESANLYSNWRAAV